MDLINRNKDKLEKLCEKHKVNELYVFGSILTDEFNELSDIDFLIQFLHVDLPEYFDNYMDLLFLLEKMFKRKIDLVIEKDLHPELNYVKKEAKYVRL